MYIDYDLFDFTAKKVEKCWKKGQSFFVFSFTGSTHIEYMSVTEQFNKYPPDSSKINTSMFLIIQNIL
ncbi:hypothetical protein AGMMS49921_10560 [Endomicrobiia bacterium]|nr:hypothetical protein AGMMS49921_10560 [Endomicrobiia bacterium]